MAISLALCPKCGRPLNSSRSICVFCQQIDWQAEPDAGSDFIAPEPDREPEELRAARKRMEAEWEKNYEPYQPLADGPQSRGCAVTGLVILAVLLLLALGALFFSRRAALG